MAGSSRERRWTRCYVPRSAFPAGSSIRNPRRDGARWRGDWAGVSSGAARTSPRRCANRSPPRGDPEPFRGKYGPRHITLEGGQLYYQREGRSKIKLLPLDGSTFLLDGLGTFRVRFVEDGEGRVTKLAGLYADGQEDESPRAP